MNETVDFVGGKIFKNIKSDERVNENLSECLYCRVSQSRSEGESKLFSIKDIPYQIPLDCISGNSIKQCPACKTIYLLKDPTDG